MATICDACGAKYAPFDDGGGSLKIAPTPLSPKMIEALVEAGKPIEHRSRVEHDLCLGCTAKALAHLGLPTDVCTPPEIPTANAPASMAGALTPEELVALGLDPNTQ